MKKIILSLFITMLLPTVINAEEININTNLKTKITKTHTEDVIRIQCNGDVKKRTKNNQTTGDIFTFTIKNGKLYDREGNLVKDAVITDEEIKGKMKYKNGMTWENTRFQINRYTGGFSYHTIFRTLEGASQTRNTGICKQIKNEKLF